MADQRRVTDAQLDGTATIYLRIGDERLAFDAVELRDLVKERAAMCGWRRDGDCWLIPDHIAMWYANRHKVGGRVIGIDAHRERVRVAQVDWWKSYDSPAANR